MIKIKIRVLRCSLLGDSIGRGQSLQMQRGIVHMVYQRTSIREAARGFHRGAPPERTLARMAEGDVGGEPANSDSPLLTPLI